LLHVSRSILAEWRGRNRRQASLPGQLADFQRAAVRTTDNQEFWLRHGWKRGKPKSRFVQGHQKGGRCSRSDPVVVRDVTGTCWTKSATDRTFAESARRPATQRLWRDAPLKPVEDEATGPAVGQSLLMRLEGGRGKPRRLPIIASRIMPEATVRGWDEIRPQVLSLIPSGPSLHTGQRHPRRAVPRAHRMRGLPSSSTLYQNPTIRPMECVLWSNLYRSNHKGP
jgi:hypothetical protein